MKIKASSLFVIIGVLITGFMIFSILFYQDELGISKLIIQSLKTVPESEQAASIPKETILVLIAVGIIGVLVVGRKKKGSRSNAPNNVSSQAGDYHEINEGYPGYRDKNE